MKSSSFPSKKAILTATLLLLPVQHCLSQVNLPVLGDSLSGTISTQQEYEFGREFLRNVRSQTPVLNDPLIVEYIASLTYKLAVESELTDHRLEFVLIDSDLLNAFAAPGGIVGVNAGLFMFAQNEGQFASVLAHELAHISQRHYARNVEQARNNAIPNMAALLASLAIMATAGGEAGQAALLTSQALSVDNQLRFSRSHEAEADRIGIRNLFNAGFNPTDMAGMFEQMLRASSSSQKLPEFLSSHPLDENRIADSKNRANNFPETLYIPNPEYQLMRERVIMHYTRTAEAEYEARRSALPQLRGADADAARYGMTLALLKMGRHVEAIQTLEHLLQQEPSRITYVLLAVEVAVAAGNFEKALDLLSEHLRVNPGNNPLTMTYAATLTKAEKYEEAAQVLENHAASHANDMQLWYELAEVQGLAGNISKVHLARAEYFICIGDFARARDQLDFALTLETDRLVVAKIRQRQDYIREIEAKFYR
jgi:predicted Zn-dependent protease